MFKLTGTERVKLSFKARNSIFVLECMAYLSELKLTGKIEFSSNSKTRVRDF